MTASRIRFIVGTIAVCLIVDVTIRAVHVTYRHFNRNRLLDKYTDSVTGDGPPVWLRIAGFVTSLLLNLIIYFIF